MAAIINIYKTASYSDAYSKDGAMDDPIWPRSGFIWDGEDGQYRDIQLYMKNDGDEDAWAIVVSVADISGTDESTWGKLALTQAGLAGATPGASLQLGDMAPGAIGPFWLRITVPASTPPEDKVDLRVRTSASISSMSSSSSESSISTSSCSSSQSSSSLSSSASSESSSSSSSQHDYLCDNWLLAVAHHPISMVYIYEQVGDLNLLDTIATPGSFPDAVAMFNGDLIVADSVLGKIYIYSGTSTVAYKDSFSVVTGGNIITGLTILNNNLIHVEVGDYPSQLNYGKIYIHEGMTSAITQSMYTPSENIQAITNALGDIFSADRWDQRIFRHSGQSGTIKSYYDAYKLTVSPFLSDVRGMAYDSCKNLLEYDTRDRKLFVHDGVTSDIQATVNYALEFTDINCPVGSSSSSSSSSSSLSSSSSCSSASTGCTFSLLDTEDVGGYAVNCCFYGSYIHVANQSDGVRAFTYSGGVLNSVGNYNPSSNVYNGIWVDSSGNIFAARWSASTGVIDVLTFDGANYHLQDSVSFACGSSDIRLMGDGTYVYVASGSSGVRAFQYIGGSISQVGVRDDGGFYRYIWVSNGFIFVARDSSGFSAYTFSVPTFTLVDTMDDIPGITHSLYYDGTTLHQRMTGYLRAFSFSAGSFSLQKTHALASETYQISGMWGFDNLICLADSDDLKIFTYDIPTTTYTLAYNHESGVIAYAVWGDSVNNLALANYDNGVRLYNVCPN